MNKYLCIMVFLSLLTSCGITPRKEATTENYTAILDSWINSPEHELVESWGPPTSFYDNGGGVRYLTYKKSSSYIQSGTPSTASTYVDEYGNASTTIHQGSEDILIEYRCETTFTVQDTYIVNWKIKGNSCKAYAPEEKEN